MEGLLSKKAANDIVRLSDGNQPEPAGCIPSSGLQLSVVLSGLKKDWIALLVHRLWGWAAMWMAPAAAPYIGRR